MGEGGFSSDVLLVRFVHNADPRLGAGRVWGEKEKEREENRVEIFETHGFSVAHPLWPSRQEYTCSNSRMRARIAM